MYRAACFKDLESGSVAGLFPPPLRRRRVVHLAAQAGVVIALLVCDQRSICSAQQAKWLPDLVLASLAKIGLLMSLWAVRAAGIAALALGYQAWRWLSARAENARRASVVRGGL